MKDVIEELPAENRIVLSHLMAFIYDLSGGNVTLFRDVRFA